MQFQDACQDFKAVMEHPVMEQQTKQAYVLQTDAYILMARFFSLHPDISGRSETFAHRNDLLPIYLCTKAVDISVWLVKMLQRDEGSLAVKGNRSDIEKK